MQTRCNKWLAALMLLALLPEWALAASAEPQQSWLDIPQQQLVYLQLSDGDKTVGQVVLQLADPFTPKTSARFRQLVQDRFYDGLGFYRVIDQFVLQAGLPEDETHPAKLTKSYPPLPAEFSWPIRGKDFYTPVQSGDMLAEETGFNQGFAVGRAKGREWLIHCPNLVNMARDANPASATTDFAIMQGQAPRHLDQNMNVFGRVIWGTEVLNLVPRGDKAAGGILGVKARRGMIVSARLGSELPKAAQLPLQQQLTNSDDFQQMLKRRRARSDEFYQDKGNGKLDICYLGAPVRLKTAQ
ncbi:peptidylprolyl isomerase [Rheinheimera texasensis]|uniref:peptidylprolyl isomerase n=1 Tax=Rheinheimera texasensis TaxID=306205 RepID=UPI0032B12FA2